MSGIWRVLKSIKAVLSRPLLLLTAISVVVLLVKLYDYSKLDDIEVLMNPDLEEEIEIFSVEYKEDTEELRVSGADGQKIIYPGTFVEYTIRLRNSKKIAIDYEMAPDVSFTSEHKIPIFVRMLDDEGEYVIGDDDTWVSLEDVEGMKDTGTLRKRESVSYVFQWKWDFESGDDAYDTFLGNTVESENIGVSMKFDLTAESNTDLLTNDVVIAPSDAETVFVIIAVIAIAAAVLYGVVYVVKKRREY